MIIWVTTILDQLIYIMYPVYYGFCSFPYFPIKGTEVIYERSSGANHSDQTAVGYTLNCGLSSRILPQDTLALQV